MNQRHQILLLLILAILLLTGCSNNTAQPKPEIPSGSIDIQEPTTVSETNSTAFPTSAPSITYPFQEMDSEGDEDEFVQSMGGGGIEWWLRESERGNAIGRQVTYSGDPIEVNYRFHSAEGINERGFFIFVDGFVQPFQVVATDQKNDPPELNQGLTIARINLPDGDEVIMKISFTPVTGNAGDELCVHFFVLNYPDYIPEVQTEPVFPPSLRKYVSMRGLFGFPFTLVMAKDSPKSMTSLVVESDLTPSPTPEFGQEDSTWPTISLYSKDDPSKTKYPNTLQTADGKLNLTFSISGGREETYRITFFVNIQPVMVDGYDNFLIRSKLDKVVSHDFTLDLSGYDSPSTLFAIIVPTGLRCEEAFYTQQSDPITVIID